MIEISFFLMVFCTLWDEGYYSNRSNLNKTFYSQNVENYNNTNYNISYEVIPYISADERKTKFLKYSRAESFYELDYDTMDRAIAVGAKYAIEAQNKGSSNSYFTDDNYMYYFNVLNTNNNAFGITYVEEIEDSLRSDVDEKIKMGNNGLFNENSKNEQKSNIGNINTTENRTTSNNDVELVRGQQRQQGINERRQNTTESIRDSIQELDNSSFSNIIETSINEAIDYLGDDGKFDTERNTESLYNEIWEYVEKELNRDLTDNEYVSFVEKLKTMWEDAYYSNESNLKKEMFSIKEDNNGNKYVNVDRNQDIFRDKNLVEQIKIAKQYILDNFRQNGININNENINVTSKTANEYTHPKNKLPIVTKSSKMKASTELDNLLSISEFKYSRPDDGRHPFAKDGWDYYETTFKVGDNLFTGLVNIGKSGNKKTLYDLTNIKRIDQNRSTSANAFSTSLVNSVKNNIPQNGTNVKSSSTKYSIPINENNTQNINISNIIETSINEAIDYLGDDGKFDVEENTDNLYDRIYFMLKIN